jgi:hypothetical protein
VAIKDVKSQLLVELQRRFSTVTKLPGSQSLYDLGEGRRVYVRYSKLHPDRRTFYGLRQTDLRQLEGFQSLLCFLWDGQTEPLLAPYRDFEDVFAGLTPASDGQFKAQVYPDETGTELYIANAGRFNVEGYIGWNETNSLRSQASERWNRELTHHQVQTLLGAIGVQKGHAVWLPRADRARLDWSLTSAFNISDRLSANRELEMYARDIDVVWITVGAAEITALFEVEHSTAIYSGLLRFNDVRLLAPTFQPRFTIVANDSRRSRFTSQINRPTFKASGFADRCSFLDYANVLEWHAHLVGISSREAQT